MKLCYNAAADTAVGHSLVLTPAVWSCTPARCRTVPPPEERQEAAATKALCFAYPDLCKKGENTVRGVVVQALHKNHTDQLLGMQRRPGTAHMFAFLECSYLLDAVCEFHSEHLQICSCTA
jgi:hypothetical protein